MSKLRLLSIAVIGLILINMVIVGFLLLRKPIHLGPGRPPMEQEGPKQVIIERLNLDDVQIAEYGKLITSHQETMKMLEDSIKLMKNNLYQTLKEEAPADKDTLIDQLNSLQKQIEVANYEHFVGLKKICRSEQLDKFNKLTAELARFFAIGNKNAPPPKN
ncbi:MAG: hypothetical protein IPL55_24405 [Saprospiraceae bacterium]|nr:hypothetical protein [Saprospiraceae bacterium]